MTLCVALVAFLSIEPALSDHSNQFPVQTGMASAAMDNAAADQTRGDSDQSGGLVTGSIHHCCATHIAGLPSVADAPRARLMVLSDSVPLADVIAPEFHSAGPERPPRPSALS